MLTSPGAAEIKFPAAAWAGKTRLILPRQQMHRAVHHHQDRFG